MKLTHLKSKVLPTHLSSTLHSMLPAYLIIEKAVWLPPRSLVMTMTMMMVHTDDTLRATCQSCEHINEGGGWLCLTNWTLTNLLLSSGSTGLRCCRGC